MYLTRFLVLLFIYVISFSSCHADKPQSYQVGLAKVDITPDYPVLLNGYASRGTDLIDQVEQPLWARAIAVLNQQGQAHVLISVENCGVPALVTKRVVANLKEEYQVRPAGLVVCSTHTHAAPMLTGVLPNIYTQDLSTAEQAVVERYTSDLIQKLTTVAQQAIKDVQPAFLEWGIGTATFAKNRRNISGPTDYDLPVLRVKSPEGKARAILVGYACHCTTLGGVPFMSGDWAGCAVEEVEADIPGCMAMVVIGCGADQNPKFRGDDQGAARVNGKAVAAGIQKRLKTGLTAVTGNLSAFSEEIKLPLATLPTVEEWKQRVGKPGITGYHAKKNLNRLERGEVLTDHVQYPIKTWSFGDDLAMVFLGGEVVVDYSLAIKQKHGAKVWVNSYANDVPCYIPSERVLQEGGYEGKNAMVWYDLPGPLASGVEKKILDVVSRQLPDSFKAVDDVSRTGGKRPLTPAESISRMNLTDDLKVEVVAAEPLVVDPVAVDFGPDGKLWVVEMRDYPAGMDGNYKPGGVVKYLEDLNQDGRYDKATVFLEGLAFPTGVMVWKQGVLVCTAPDVMYAEDTTGDGKADIQKKILTGFATHNYQARVNSLVPGLDNWVYASGGLFGGIIQSFNGQTVNVTNRDFRFQPETGVLEPVSGRTQQGRVRDDWGNWFGCRNGTLCVHYPVNEIYFQKNPYVSSPPPEVSIPQGENANQLFPVGELVQFHLSGQRGRPTSACGLGLYRDKELGKSFYGNAFICEPVNQLVHRLVVKPEGVTFSGLRAPEEQERDFLTSTDNWFRPVQARTAPDGSLLIVDMYRYLIEHPKFLSPEAVQKLNVRAGETRGRIYRISAKDQTCQPVPDLNQLPTQELTQLLNSANGTLRDMVQQELILRGDKKAVPSLSKLASDGALPQSRLQALCTLDGLQALTPDVLLPRINEQDPGVRRESLRLAEPFLKQSEKLANAVLERVNQERELPVQLQLAYTLGYLKKDEATNALLQLLEQHSENVYLRSAVLTSFKPARLSPALVRLLPRIEANPQLLPMFHSLLDMAVATRDPGLLKQVSTALSEHIVRKQKSEAWEWLALTQLTEAMPGRDKSSLEKQGLQWKQLISLACRQISETKQSVAVRIAALQFVLSVDQSQDTLELVADLLSPQTALNLQMAALKSLIQSQSPAAVELVFNNWKQFTPALQAEVISQLLSRESSTLDLLNRIEQKVIQPAQIDLTNRQTLIDHKNEKIKQRARKLFSVATSASREAILKQYASIDLKQGSVDRGSLVFEKQCANCHRLNGKGHVVGPDLAALTDQSKSFLLTSILDPNKAVDGRYASYLAVTDDGRINTGILVSEQSNSITLKAQQGKVQTILRTQLDELINSGKSLMPEGLEREIPPAAMADLLVYLQEHSAPLKYTYAGSVKPDANYPDDPQNLKLVNRSTGSTRFNDGQWVGFRFAGTEPQPRIVIDLQRKIPVNALRIVYGVNHEPGSIHAPSSIEVAFSNNSKQYGNPHKFSGFDDHADGLGLYEIDRRTTVINIPEQRAQFVRIDFQGKQGWIFLSEISLASASSENQNVAVPVQPVEKSVKTKGAAPGTKIKALVAEVKVGTPDEYRNIPEIWRTAIAVGKRNQADEIRDLLEVSLPGPDKPLECWQAVVIGGGVINGITIAGDWPRSKIELLLKEKPELAVRWKQALLRAVKMAEDPNVKGGTRYDALRMVAMLDYDICQKQLKRYLNDASHAELQMGAVSGLGDIDVPTATADLIESLPVLTPRNQKIALLALIRTDARAIALLKAIQQQQHLAKLIDGELLQRLKTHQTAEVQQLANQIFD
ncbi:Neutral/alkaline non-lysosomal ceramidase [Gimesia maris]|uniref:neutral/alkaline non-lysosomal ceramidase N-terminal domain-containing protein n=1 Tax=Gimesia maris TaxID=122 RepID=UPI0011893DC9|nr:neutral/alkaline non-lysosomal ceramidase N-terminal domain-containing protein [Gimesia maris]QDU13677.1 Neutral/alkaline non-lysosomal ceramidase [Gimesia maris]